MQIDREEGRNTNDHGSSMGQVQSDSDLDLLVDPYTNLDPHPDLPCQMSLGY